MSEAPLAREALSHAPPAAVRAAVRARRWTGNTKRLALGHHQANVTIVPERHAFDFMRFCQRNPRAFPLLDVTDPGDAVPRLAAPDADLRTDIAAFCIYRDGRLTERVEDLRPHWRKDHVAFLTGCNLSLDQVLIEAAIPFPHLTRDDAFPAQYRASIACRPAGVFHGPLVVSYRPVPEHLLLRVIELTSRYPLSHGGPVHVGDPARIGIADLANVDWGQVPREEPGTVPCFWACGITAQAAALASGIPEIITHAPGHMFVTDLAVSDRTLG
ncbi:D-glutamate cyclase family protein [Falsiroseomonas oryzae]|uniref:D-glutamate cyclase family protein n=1 Tax=Falsiroseomonas oryzae TaxID=2766473 RepID=UPI0022EA27B1|nr:DUF1445 domain-containing protein [Roseomonas sp. MO-31]